jgi:hypothetical protein
VLTGIVNEMLILGLSDKNIERLKTGHPIFFQVNERFGVDLASMRRVLIFHAETEEALIKVLKEHGMDTDNVPTFDLRRPPQ